jgi:hypothetical protein
VGQKYNGKKKVSCPHTIHPWCSGSLRAKENRTIYGAQKYGHGYGGYMDERKSTKNTIREIIKKNMYLQVTNNNNNNNLKTIIYYY